MCLLFRLSFFVFSSLMKCVFFVCFLPQFDTENDTLDPLDRFIRGIWYMIRRKQKQMNKYIYYKCIHYSTESVLSIYTLHTYIQITSAAHYKALLRNEWPCAITPMALLCRDNKRRAIISAETVGRVLSLDAASLPRSAAAAAGDIDRAASCSNSWATPWFSAQLITTTSSITACCVLLPQRSLNHFG